MSWEVLQHFVVCMYEGRRVVLISSFIAMRPSRRPVLDCVLARESLSESVEK